MRAFRISLLLLFTLALSSVPAIAQIDSILVAVAGEQYLGLGAAFGARFPQPGTNIGPFPIIAVEGTGETGDPEEGCDPLVNADELAGSIAFFLRGSCTFVQKVLNAQEAGAEAVVVYADNCPSGCDGYPIVMGGDCAPESCSIPALYVSRSSGLSILEEIASGPTEATLIPIRVGVSVSAEEAASVESFALHPVYPNPASAQTTVTLDVPTGQVVRVAAFDVLGRAVTVLHDGPLAAGAHRFVLDTARLPAGLYLVRASGEGSRVTRKLVVAR
jgi:hypothetical protein